jgi:hypothetical protein
MSTPTTPIEISEYTLTVSRLKVKDSLKGLRLVGKVLLPALAEAHSAPSGQVGNAIQRAVEGLDCLPDLLDLFVAVTQWTSPARSAPTPLKEFVEQIFGGRPDLVVEFLVACVKQEYSGFLAGNGQLAKLFGQATAAAATAPVADASSSPKT